MEITNKQLNRITITPVIKPFLKFLVFTTQMLKRCLVKWLTISILISK